MSARAVVGLGPSLRRAAFSPRYARTQLLALSALGKRGVQTESLPPSASTEILNKQRLQRPSSPHFTIYQPQLTWLGSIANRVTGSGLSVLLYGYALAYLAAPATFASANVVALVAGLPVALKFAGKAVLAAPFAFHSLNGIRHLGWDTGYFLTLKGAYRSGYVVLGATAVSTVALMLM